MTWRGQLLVASPLMGDPNFERSVVLILAHGEEGALGVVLNRPRVFPIAAQLQRWEALAAAPAVLFEGGPVASESAIGLALIAAGRTHPSARPRDLTSFSILTDRVATVDLSEEPQPGIDKVRVFAGYAGWGAEQLESEVDAGAWFLVPSRPTDVFSSDPDGLWRKVLRRQRSSLAMLSSYPDDLQTN